jgi:PAS domain S-box-containing protein
MEQSNTSTPTGGTEQVQTKTALEKALQEIKRRNEALRASEHDLSLIINTIPALVWSARPDGSAEFFNQHYLDYVGLPAEQVKDWGWTVAVHPDDLNGLAGSWQSIMDSGKQGESEARLRRFDGEYRCFLFRANPLRDESGNIVKWFGINTDIEDRKRAEDALRRSEGYLTEAQRLTHTGSWAWNVATSTRAYWSQENYRMFGFDPELGLPSDEALSQRIHPEDRDKVRREAFPKRTAEGSHFDVEYRIVLPDGVIRHLHSVGRPVLNESGDLVEFVGTTMDITERKKAEEKIRQDAHELCCIIDSIPQVIGVHNPDGEVIDVNRVALEAHGLSIEEVRAESLRDRVIHPEDIERLKEVRQNALLNGVLFDIEQRVLRKDGKYRWFLTRYNPFRDEQGRLVRWYATSIDIEDRKVAEQRLQNENVALREEVDRVSMFDEIVGASTALSTVLARVAKVAPVDSTVLITGETGTGKELIARAIHKRSRRAQRAFVSVNCAALAPSLISSELFGHEKGAFTGATQRRVGRFESANGGTLFLDEVGELPLDTQIALLRVLQEREFERVGGNDRIKVDVRIIAATNRDLNVAQADGTFRSDLFYRLNVFPIHVPPLRERREDIEMLLEYFLNRYAKQVGKVFRSVDKHTLDLFRDYAWPGNIRELQNVIERSVVLSQDSAFCADNSWLSSIPSSQHEDGSDNDSQYERNMIESALAQSRGRISGPRGAAARLGLRPSTLDSRIKKLKIRTSRFKLG